MLGIRLSDPIGQLVGDPVATIRPTATLREAADALAADAVGLLVVVDARGVTGVFSERDIVTAIVDDVDLDDGRVRDYATSDVVQVERSVSVLDAAAVMSEAQVRHLAVADRGVVTGVVSIRDVVTVLVEERQAAASN
jgi:signal-transduction protein with cAMP-binding, CBS, and nucleotidyltransferase domain